MRFTIISFTKLFDMSSEIILEKAEMLNEMRSPLAYNRVIS